MLIANRGEIVVRIALACKDAVIASVAVYVEPDLDALHVRTADEAFAFGGATPADSYLDVDKILTVAEDSGADAVHPGYGFLAENAGFARAVIDAWLTWIGPPPNAIDSLGDKVKARYIAESAGAPGGRHQELVKDADEVVAFAKEHCVPVEIKAAYGGEATLLVAIARSAWKWPPPQIAPSLLHIPTLISGFGVRVPGGVPSKSLCPAG